MVDMKRYKDLGPNAEPVTIMMNKSKLSSPGFQTLGITTVSFIFGGILIEIQMKGPRKSYDLLLNIYYEGKTTDF